MNPQELARNRRGVSVWLPWLRRMTRASCAVVDIHEGFALVIAWTAEPGYRREVRLGDERTAPCTIARTAAAEVLRLRGIVG